VIGMAFGESLTLFVVPLMAFEKLMRADASNVVAQVVYSRRLWQKLRQ
jgi:hypothetical protein